MLFFVVTIYLMFCCLNISIFVAAIVVICSYFCLKKLLFSLTARGDGFPVGSENHGEGQKTGLCMGTETVL